MKILAVGTLVLGYAFSSSMLAIINKYAVTVFPYPAILTAMQYLACTLAVILLGQLRIVDHDSLSWGMVKKFLPAATVFYVAIFTNTELLKHANVETFIIFRSSTPLMVAIADSLFMGRPWPSKSTFASLVVILVGALGYVLFDTTGSVTGYYWALAYLCTITFEMVYIKHVVMTVGLKTWGLVFYNNLLALIFFPPTLIMMGEQTEIMQLWEKSNFLTPGILIPVLLSCIFGLTISFFGFACRQAVSATAYTVIGVTNKLLTVFVNLIIWDKHASLPGTISLLVCIAGGVLYQQSVSKAPALPLSKPVYQPPEDLESADTHAAEKLWKVRKGED